MSLEIGYDQCCCYGNINCCRCCCCYGNNNCGSKCYCYLNYTRLQQPIWPTFLTPIWISITSYTARTTATRVCPKNKKVVNINNPTQFGINSFNVKVTITAVVTEKYISTPIILILNVWMSKNAGLLFYINVHFLYIYYLYTSNVDVSCKPHINAFYPVYK